MKAFHEPTESQTTTPVYNSETVRKVLLRASQIEEEAQVHPALVVQTAEPRQPDIATTEQNNRKAQTDPAMTLTQVEMLGQELGLSPNTVRRALSEQMGILTVSAATRRGRLPFITPADMMNVVKNAVAYSVLAAVLAFVSALISHDTASFRRLYEFLPFVLHLHLLSVLFYALGAFIFPFVYGWRRKDWRQGMVLGVTIVPIYVLCLWVVVFVCDETIKPQWSIDWMSYSYLAIVPAITGALGGGAGLWSQFEKLEAERKRQRQSQR